MRRRQLIAAFATAAFGGFSSASHAARGDELFRIERSKNKNVVVYDFQRGPGGLHVPSPVSAFWLMLAEDGRREELSWAERKLAYGYDVTDVSAEGCVLKLSACSKRQLRIERKGNGFRAICKIAGQRAVLDRIFVQTSEGALLPSVQHVDLFGKNATSGLPLKERLTN